MKKALVVTLFFAAVLGICCQKNDDDSESDMVDWYSTERITDGDEDSYRLLTTDAAIEAAFTLDYRPQKAEGEDEAEVLSAAALSGAASGAAGGGTVIGGGLRKLADYQTVYFDPVKEKSRIEAIRAAQEAALAGGREQPGRDAGPLTVLDWGPRGDYSSTIQRPSIYVIFSQPMIALAALGEQSSTSPVLSINPPIKGAFRWYGTGFLSFEGEEPCQSQQTYTITVAPNAASIYGTAISGERIFTFHTETLRVVSIIPGEEFRKTSNFRFDNNNVPPKAAGEIGIEFNYPVRAGDIQQYIEITANNSPKRFTLKQESAASKDVAASLDAQVTASLTEPVDFGVEVKVTLKQGAKSRGGTRGTETDQNMSFHTPGTFKVDKHRQVSGYGRYRNMAEIDFSYPLNEKTVLPAIKTEPAMAIRAENIEIWGNTVRLFNLPVTYGSKFRILVAASIEDVYGRTLGGAWSGDITVPDEPPPQGEAHFLDWGQTMLEAQFPPRFLFEYKNIVENSSYLLAASGNPWSDILPAHHRVVLNPGKANNNYFEDIDLSPYLNKQGKGFVAFRANLQLINNERQSDGTYRSGTYERNNELNIQVTDLGLTVRYGFNKAAVLVTSLSTGKPVEGALVRLLSPSLVKSESDILDPRNFGEALTDKNGLAVLPMSALTLRSNTRSDSWRGFDEPFVMAEKDGDRALFNPSSHNIWRFGVESNMPQRAEEVKALAFMFSDRGLYKPGETVSFRGLDRVQTLGMYSIYQGDYTVTLEEDAYRSKEVATIRDTTSESGSFYGKIAIPDDTQPGSYRLVYKRNDGQSDRIIANVPVTIAFFERLKFQASLSAPAAAVISGDDINITLQASYLSGGSLSGASWESAWSSEMSAFYSGSAETKGYTFGPRRVWDSKRFIASESGMLNGQGTASLSQKTGGSHIAGAPYRYQAEARVTDISNQMVSTYRSVMVHPASFYIGLYRGARGIQGMPGGFARSGQELSYDYITVNNEGEKVSGNALFLQSGEDSGRLTVELVREEWRRVQQQGVNGYIYDEYSREDIIDSVQKIAIKSGGGSIKIKPTAAGYHTLRVSARDREGRTALTELSFYVTGSGGYWNMSNPDELRLTPDQDMYLPGDTAKILLQSTLPEGSYLITVEREGIFTEEVRHFTEPVTVIDIPIARNFVPVVYVAVSSYSVRSGPPSHEYGSPDLDKPKGYFGVTRLMVNPRARAFSVKVESDKKTYRPGEEVTMTLTATRDGRPVPQAELTLMAVDRGVLDLINYHVPDPIRYFYSENHFPLSVAGGDSRSMLMDPVTYSVKNLAGGDAGGGDKIEERKDFNPTAVFEPLLITDAAGKITCTFKLPDNLTTYRVTVFGVKGDIFALKESEIAAQNKINIREVLPRRTRERDTAEAGVLITNLDSAPHTITVDLNIGPPLPDNNDGGIVKIPGQAKVDGIAQRRVTVKSGENAVVYFDVAAVKEGNVTLNFTINSDILNERLIRELIIEHPYVMETVTTTGTVDRDSSGEGVVIPSFADNGTGSLSLILDATRLSLLDSAITYLFRYPYGCLEQRSAAILPLVVFGEYLDSLNLKHEVSNPPKVVETELRSWAGVQLSGGGFPYWPSGTRGDFYVSLRIAHIVAIARSKKMAIPSSLNMNALNAYLNREYQQMQGRQSNSSSNYYQSYLQSYMLYVQALLGERIDPSRLAEILSRENTDPSTLAFVGMTYRIMERPADAANTARRLRNLIRMTARGADITDPLDKNRSSYYGSAVEQLALALQFFADQYPGDEINTRLLYSLLENKRAGGFWENTAVTVRVLSAVDALIRAENLANIDINAAVKLAGTELLAASFKGLGAKPVSGTFDFNDPVLAQLPRDLTQSLDFTRAGRGSVYYTASLRYAIPSELQSFRDEGIGVYMSIYDIKTGEEIAGSALKNGTAYRARLRVSSNRDRTYLALRVPIPSGAEILDAAFVTSASYGESDGEDENQPNGSWISHQYILDNEIQYFWDRFYKGESTVNFIFRTARRGVYPTPPAQAECMYEPEIFGRDTGVIYTIE